MTVVDLVVQWVVLVSSSESEDELESEKVDLCRDGQ